MKTATITQVKNNLSALIDGLKSGSPVLILDRGRPVARLEPVTPGRDSAEDVRVTRLVRDGLARPRRSSPPSVLFSEPPPQAKQGVSVLAALLEERQEGR